MAGSGDNLERINLSDESVLTSTVSSSAGSTTRSLAADACGNVVSGHKSGTSLQFQYSTDSGQTFSTAQTVVTSGDRANASINTTNGDVMFLYESAGNIYLSTYSGLFGSGTNCYAASISQTAIEFTAPGQTPSIILNNTSSNPLSVDSISITGSAFTISHTCGTSIAPGGSCVVSINGTNQADETLSIVLGGTRRTIPVSLGSVAALQPVVIPSTTVPSITTPPTTAPEQTSTTSLPPQQTPENPVALSPPVTGSPQPVFTETEKTKVNSGSEIKNTSLPETGIQTVYVLLLSVYIMSLGFFLIIFKKSKQK
jgi:LPXTG-motif cell wall-anchored protein